MLTRPRTLHRQRHGTITDAAAAVLGMLRDTPPKRTSLFAWKNTADAPGRAFLMTFPNQTGFSYEE